MVSSSKKSLLVILSVLIFFFSIFAVCMFFFKRNISKNSLVVKMVYVSDTKYSDRNLIKNLIKDIQYKNINDLNVEPLKAELFKLPFVKYVSILKKYPNEVIIKITEKNIRYIGDNGYPLDEDLNIITEQIKDKTLHNSFIVLSGNINKSKVEKLFKILNKFPLINKNITSANLISDRRWNISVKLYGRNILFKLPESDIDFKINNFFRKIYKSRFFVYGISTIDLRSDKIVFYK